MVSKNSRLILLQVTFERMPKADRGFEVDYACFSLGSRQEATLQIGWVPQCSRPLRESMIVKFTSKAGTHKTQVQLNATVKAPPQVVKCWGQKGKYRVKINKAWTL